MYCTANASGTHNDNLLITNTLLAPARTTPAPTVHLLDTPVNFVDTRPPML